MQFGACRTSGDVLRNFGAASAARMVKVGYGLAILGTVPLVVMPFHDSMLPLVACLGPPRPPMGAAATPLQQQAITSLVLGETLPPLGLPTPAAWQPSPISCTADHPPDEGSDMIMMLHGMRKPA